MSRLIRAVIDAGALRHNVRTIRDRARGARIMAVVKANAYGHGLVPAALALAEVDAFAVARLEEGLALRAQGVSHPIVLLEGVFAAEQLLEAARYGFDLVVHDALQIELLEEDPGPHRFVLWVKIDTGMNRLGFRPSEFPAAFERLRKLQPAPLEIRLLTHLARADEPDDPMTAEQVARFREAIRGLDCAISIANSAGVFSELHLGCDWVRPGLALYGASPFANRTAANLGLLPVMSLETSVIAVRNVPRGETVGYGGDLAGAAGLENRHRRGRLRRWTRPRTSQRHARTHRRQPRAALRPGVDGHDRGRRDGAPGRTGRQPGGAMGEGTSGGGSRPPRGHDSLRAALRRQPEYSLELR